MKDFAVFRIVRVAALAVLLAGRVAAQEATPTSTPHPEPIPVAEISMRATDVAALLRRVEATAESHVHAAAIAAELPEIEKAIESELADASGTLDTQPPLETVTALNETWLARRVRLTEWKDALSAEAQAYESVVETLSKELKSWKYTGTTLPADTPAVVVDRVKSTTAAIRASQKVVKAQNSLVLGLQDRVSTLLIDVEQVVGLAEHARKLRIENLLSQDAPRLWEIPALRGNSAGLVGRLRNVASAQVKSVLEFVSSHAVLVSLHLLAIVLVAVALVRVRNRLHAEQAEHSAQVDVKVFDRPIAVAVLLGLAVIPAFGTAAPRAAYDLAGLLMLVPVIRIAVCLVDSFLHPWVYALGGFFLLDRLRAVLATIPVVEQCLFLVEMISAIAVLLVLVQPHRMQAMRETFGARAVQFIRLTVLPLLGLYSAATVASSMGYGQLGRLLGGGALHSIYVALALYAGRRALEGIMGHAIMSPTGQRLNLARSHAIEVFAGFQRTLIWAAAATWLVGTLSGFALLDDFRATLEGFFAASFSRGSLTVSIGDIAAFLVTIWLSFAVSRWLRFVLEEDVYPRLNVAPGVPYALSRLVHYAVLTVGFFAGAAMIGLDSDRLAFLVGAFGVGIGFGLQNVVNNFVSGIILLFERPVQVGDSVQIGDLLGKVERIGIRSSTLRTVTGAEVIVPNANLISDPLTNWTLSDRRRLIQVPIGVAYGSDTALVMQLLEEAARNNSGVLSEPPPRALFLGFGDSSLNFELRFWTGEFDTWVVTRSEVVTAVDTALREARIEIPFPQRDVRIRSNETKPPQGT